MGLNVGEPIRDEDDYFGTPVVIAKRLCDVAGGGQILASELVRGVLGGRGDHEFRPLGPIALKGLDEPMPACEIVWKADDVLVAIPPAVGVVDASPLIGRANDLGRLEEELANARRGAGRLVLVAGEPGIGKTRLALEFARGAYADGATVLYGRCDDDALVPYQPFVEALRHLIVEATDDDLGAILGSTGHELTRVVPELRDRLPDLAEPFRGESDIERARLHDATVDLLRAVAERTALVLVLDDLHWADTPTLVLLKHLARAASNLAGVLIVGTYRDVELDRRHPLAQVLADLRRDSLYERVLLRGLSADDVVAMLEARSESTLDAAGHGLARAVHRETEGNPFFIREIIRHLVETNTIRQEDGRWVSELTLEQIGLPESVREVIGRRLSLLSEGCDDVLRVASVIGREFTVDVLARVTETTPAALADLLDEATRARVVDEVPEEFDRFSFSHMLVRETLYEELTTSRRVRVHQRIGRVLEELRPDPTGEDLNALARHFREAALIGEVDRAVDYGTRAGGQAMRMAAYEEAVAHYDRALQALDVADRDGDDVALAAKRSVVLIHKGEAQLAAGDTGGGRRSFFAAAEVAQATGDAEQLARAAWACGGLWVEVGGIDTELLDLLHAALRALPTEDSALRSRLMSRIAMDLAFGLDVTTASAMATGSLAMARRLSDEATLAYALVAWRHVFSSASHLEARLAASAEAAAIADRRGNFALALRARSFLLPDAVEAGDLALANDALAGIERAAAELNQARYDYLATITRAGVAQWHGRFDEAEELAVRAREAATQLGRFTGLVAAAMVLLDTRGDRDGVTASVAEARWLVDTLGASTPLFAALAPLAFAGEGDLESARRVVRDMVHSDPLPEAFSGEYAWGVYPVVMPELIVDPDVAAHIEKILAQHAGHHMTVHGTGFVGYLGPVNSALGRLATVQGHLDDAERLLRTAIVEAESMEAPSFAARAKLNLVEVLFALADGDADVASEAGALLAEVIATATELGSRDILARADAVAARDQVALENGWWSAP